MTLTARQCTLCVVGEVQTLVAVVLPLSVLTPEQSVMLTTTTASGVPVLSASWVSCPYETCPGCSSDANCPVDRPLCGAGGSGSGEGSASGSGEEDFHMCGCYTDSDCSGLEATMASGLTAICEDSICIEGCRAEQACPSWDQSCSNTTGDCRYCGGFQCADGETSLLPLPRMRR